MKRKLMILLVMLSLTAQAAPAQTTADTARTTAPGQKRMGQKFVDGNGDGVDDRLTRAGKGMRRGKDRFVDRDGDGICDERASGLGFRRGSGGKGRFMGGDAKAGATRQGGNP